VDWRRRSTSDARPAVISTCWPAPAGAGAAAGADAAAVGAAGAPDEAAVAAGTGRVSIVVWASAAAAAQSGSSTHGWRAHATDGMPRLSGRPARVARTGQDGLPCRVCSGPGLRAAGRRASVSRVAAAAASAVAARTSAGARHVPPPSDRCAPAPGSVQPRPARAAMRGCGLEGRASCATYRHAAAGLEPAGPCTRLLHRSRGPGPRPLAASGVGVYIQAHSSNTTRRPP